MSFNKINNSTPPQTNGISSTQMEIELKNTSSKYSYSSEASSKSSPVKKKKTGLLYSSSESWDPSSPECSPEKKSSMHSPVKIKRTWHNFSSSESGFSSSESSPVKSKLNEKVSPIKSLYNFLRDADPEEDLTRDNKTLLEVGLKKVEELSDTPVKKEKAKRTHELIELALPFPQDVFSKEYHENAHKRIRDSSWLPSAARSLSKSFDSCQFKPDGLSAPKRIMNVEHITTGEIREHQTPEGDVDGYHTVGCHFVPVGNPLREKLHSIVINPQTGVFCAKFPSGNGKDKFSSFFPDNIQSEQELLSKLLHATEIARCQNRTLSLVDNGNSSFLVMKYLQAGGFIEHSAFPIFYSGEYQEDAEFQILDNLTLSAADALFYAQKLGEEAVQFKINNCFPGETILIVDIAPAIGDRTGGIAQGILIFFPEQMLSF